MLPGFFLEDARFVAGRLAEFFRKVSLFSKIEELSFLPELDEERLEK
ncbi:MAG: hypothetical protein KIH01_05960 [Candidatus Freyarchaeota archaeon]|nr:hypothetical protein [Candidatus Jordarchaeia archaeon]